MGQELKLSVRFAAEATFSVSEDAVKAYADENGYDWMDSDEREEAIACWVHDNVEPQVLAMDDGVTLMGIPRPVEYEVPGESILEVKEEGRICLQIG